MRLGAVGSRAIVGPSPDLTKSIFFSNLQEKGDIFNLVP